MKLTFAVLVAGLAFAADAPYASAGFLKIPAEVKLGPMSAVEADLGKGTPTYCTGANRPCLPSTRTATTRAVSARGEFKVAHGLRADKDGNIWTTDNGFHIVRKFSPTGKVLATLGEKGVPGGDEKHFRAPDDLVFATNGDIYVADSGNGRIVHLNKSGQFVSQLAKRQGKRPVCHGARLGNRLQRPDLRSRPRQQPRAGLRQFRRVFVHLDGFGNPFGLLVVGKQLLVSEGDVNKIFHFDLASGQIVNSWGDSQTLQLPHLMSTDRKGNLYVAEVNGKRVQIFRRK